MAAQGSQFRFNNGAPAEVSPRSALGGLASGLANIGGGGADVDVLMSQYAAAQNNDPEALVRARRAARAGVLNAPARAHCAAAARSGRQRAGRQHAMRSAAALNGHSSASARKIGPRAAAQRAHRAAARQPLPNVPGQFGSMLFCARARIRLRSPPHARAAARSCTASAMLCAC